MGSPHRIGVIGLGVIAGAYLDTLSRHPDIEIVAVADLDRARAERVASGLEGTKALRVDELLAHPAIGTVLNLTIPAAHAEIALLAIAHGKDVFGEKPLAVSLDQARQIMDAATEAGRRVGSAPDTVLGAGIQTARAVIDRGDIGRVTSATATCVSPGHELWHPQPDFYYKAGGGPLLDMGPYYITSLVHLLGPVVGVVGLSNRPRSDRIIATGPRTGESVPVEIDTHVAGILEHAGGAVSTITISFDAVRSSAEPIEVHGELASLTVPDPNQFDGDVRIRRLGEVADEIVPPTAGYDRGKRGVGLLDFVEGHGRASGEVALHVLEVMLGILASADSGAKVAIESIVERPSLVPFTSEPTWRGVSVP